MIRQYLLAIALVAWALSTGGAYTHGQRVATQKIEARIARDAQLASEQARREEARRLERHQEIVNDANRQADQARADARRASSAADRLRAQLAAGGAAGDPAAAGAGDAAAHAIRVQSDVLGECVERVRVLAAAADAARGAGDACAAAYGALTAPGQ